jgi:hypothetical protein
MSESRDYWASYLPPSQDPIEAVEIHRASLLDQISSFRQSQVPEPNYQTTTEIHTLRTTVSSLETIVRKVTASLIL